VVDAAIEAHGGEKRWNELSKLHTTWTFRGMMFKLRLRERQLHQVKASISTRTPRVEVTPFPSPERTAVFDGGAIELQSKGQALARVEDGRASFSSLRTMAWWNDFEMLYFAGYVLWNYAQLPFLLLKPGLTFSDAGVTHRHGEPWKKVIVDFPTGFPTHSPRQTFYFGPDGTLRRHDYWVGIMNKLARGARYIHASKKVDGFLLPTRIEMKLGLWGEATVPLVSLGFVDLDDQRLE
jgi:hypothetical protein